VVLVVRIDQSKNVKRIFDCDWSILVGRLGLRPRL